MSVAFVFPGQGGQFVGQGAEWAQKDPALMEVFKMADDAAGRPITKMCFEGPMEELSQTVNLQPAVLAVSLAALRLMKRQAQPAFAAGHSLGEFGALVAAGVIDEGQALALVAKRAALMDEAARRHPGAMMAVLGLPAEELGPICELARHEGEVIMANFNTPEQIVISGEIRAVSAAGKYVKMKKGRAVPLPVSGGFHSALMAEAAESFAAELDKVAFKAPRCPVAPNATGALTADAGEIKARLKKQIVSPVMWTKTVAALAEAGATEYVEAWPKLYLGSLVRKCLPKGAGAKISFPEQQ